MLYLDDKIGNVKVGLEVDLVVLNFVFIDVIFQCVDNVNEFWESVFFIIMMGDDCVIEVVWINGKCVQQW